MSSRVPSATRHPTASWVGTGAPRDVTGTALTSGGPEPAAAGYRTAVNATGRADRCTSAT